MSVHPPIPAQPARLGLAVIGLVGLGTWALSHSYQGLFHDAGLYTLQALARLHPDALSSDVFLKFGSQDRFTVFSPLYAAAGRLVGIEPAAALLTLLFQVGLLGGAWALARRVMPLPVALSGLAVLTAIPGDYGADRIFTCIEPYLTPRMTAEALVLAGLAAALSERKALAGALVAMAALLHPLMAMAGVCALYCLFLGERKPVVAVVLAIVGLKALALMAFAMPPGAWGRFDAFWLGLVEDRSPYLFVHSWSLEDWSAAAVVVATLVVGVHVLPTPRARALSRIAVLTSLSGLALSLFACDWLHLVLLTQLQPWRWQWLGTVVAALLAPQIGLSLWARGTSGRTTALLLLAAWIFAANAGALAAAAAAPLALRYLHRLQPNEARWPLLGAGCLLGIALAWRIASNLEFTEAHYLDPAIPLIIRRAMSFARDGSAPVALMALAWWLAQHRRRRPALLTLGFLAAAGCAALLPQTLRSWTASEYTAQEFERFSAWRRLIPPRSEVFWPESPLGIWMLLDRPSYLSVLQTSGLVFSRPAALELERRADALSAALGPATFMSWGTAGTGINLSRQQLETACATGEFDYLVTGAVLSAAPVAAVAGAGPASKQIRLYRCSAARGR
jgi:hypothetical protein